MSYRVFISDTSTGEHKPVTADGVIPFKVIDASIGEVELVPVGSQVLISLSNLLVALGDSIKKEEGEVKNPDHPAEVVDAEYTEVTTPVAEGESNV